MKTQMDEQLAWEAFRYVSGEMEEVENAAFEARLAEEQAAREAVADAVELAQATQLAWQPEFASPVTGKAASPWWYGVPIGIAICLAIVVVVQQLPWSDSRTATSDPANEVVDASTDESVLEVQNSDLAIRWSEVRAQQAERDSWNIARDDARTISDPAEDWLVDESESDFRTATQAPEWMMAAVSQSRAMEEMMDDMDMERTVDGPVEQ